LLSSRFSVQLGQYNDANKHLSKAAELNPDYGPIYYEMGNIYFIQKKYRQAISPYKKAVELDPENYECRQKLGESFYRIQTYYSAYTEFKKILEVSPNDPEANFMIGITAYKQAVLGELIEAFLEMFDPDLAAAQRQKRNVQGSENDRQAVYQEMAEAFLRAHNSRKNFVEATFNLALTYHEMGDLNNALTYYKEAIAIRPDLVRAHVKLAKLYEDRQEKELALAKYKEIVYVDPSYFVAHPTLGPLHNYINILDVVLGELDEKLGLESEKAHKILYDVIIVGLGPAGMTAAIYTARKGMKTLVLSKDVGGQLNITAELENYPGYSYIEAQELINQFEEHVDRFDVTKVIGEDIVTIKIGDKIKMVSSAAGNTYQGRTLIVASGKIPRPLGIPGEERLMGKGVLQECRRWRSLADVPLLGC